MPRYNYECTSCGPFDAWASIGESDEPGECPDCGGLGDRALAAPFVGSAAGGKAASAPAPVCGMGACGMCGGPPD
jgi:putative FmdB family regulatory protein